ncbi:RNA polymerase sigma factor [Xanthomonas oryzae pv. oryzicola BLS256]|uniref:RNA polymerase sigma factor n=1 Tax=Xanthomonas oryzae pv. oryzicola (strain BLS256) TaxID=383407 RepID=G7TDP0_XANOB|nr:RNA polymerase sigma factor [Xanthomonas oryzae pv. oryzicola BLS256]AKO20779.1 RNA polymerase sigma factor [Xanthomonas oryzae pv. oryzicola]PUE95293.1 sigma-70 family RNA polymerase sigma factor [Xanthomonas oryzae pv. oryzicola]
MNADTLDLMLQRDLPSAAAGCQQVDGRSALAYQNTVPPMSLAITRDIAASEDIAQEAFLRAWQRLAQLHQPASCLPWLRQTTRTLARDWLRANRHRARSGEAAELAIAMAADPAPSRADQLLQVEEEIAALDIMSALPEGGRRAGIGSAAVRRHGGAQLSIPAHTATHHAPHARARCAQTRRHPGTAVVPLHVQSGRDDGEHGGRHSADRAARHAVGDALRAGGGHRCSGSCKLFPDDDIRVQIHLR